MLKNTLILFLTIVVLGGFAQAKPSMIVAGDSWSMFPCWWRSFHTAFLEEGMDVEIAACTRTSAINIQAKNWLGTKQHQALLKRLQEKPGVSVVYLSLGGNDLISAWNTSLTPQEEEAAFTKVLENIRNVLNSIHSVRPDVKILLAGYDYSRFMSEYHKIWQYRNFYNKMGRPNARELHTAILRFVSRQVSLADNERIFFIHYNGLMQYYFGNSDVGLAKFQTTPPELISPPGNPGAWGGNPDFEQDKHAMMRITSLRDSYHLSPTGYLYIARQAIRHYLKNWLHAASE